MQPGAARPSCKDVWSSPSFGRPSAIAPEETTQTGSPPRDEDGDLSRPRVGPESALISPALADDEARPELDDDGPVQRVWVASPTTRYWRSQRSRYVTGPRGPGTASTLIPVSGTPVNANPSVNRVVACQNAAVPR